MSSQMAERSYEIMRATLDQFYSVRVLWEQAGPERTQVGVHAMLALYSKESGEFRGQVYVQAWDTGGWEIAPLCPYTDTNKTLKWLYSALSGMVECEAPPMLTPVQLAQQVPSPGQAARELFESLKATVGYVQEALEREQANPKGDASNEQFDLARAESALAAAQKVPALFK